MLVKAEHRTSPESQQGPPPRPGRQRRKENQTPPRCKLGAQSTAASPLTSQGPFDKVEQNLHSEVKGFQVRAGGRALL